jgi:2',3'-cyclic-nucleotide 2'-phosphodiesterase (5'-nucleotidase family)
MKNSTRFVALSFGAGLFWAALAFAGPNDGVAFSKKPTAFQFTLLHASDLESDLLGEILPGKAGGIARFASLTKGLVRTTKEPVLVLAAGDTFMPAPALSLNLGGKNVVALANSLTGIQASAVGNHEFDHGESFFASMIKTTNFPYLSATHTFEGGPLAAFAPTTKENAAVIPWLSQTEARLLPAVKACVGGKLKKKRSKKRRSKASPPKAADSGKMICTGTAVGLIGATTEVLRSVTTVSGNVRGATDLIQVRRAIDRQVKRLRDDGVQIVVLLSHLQDVRKELRLIHEGLVGVDIIVAGGGDNRLADGDERLLPGDKPDPLCVEERSCYPLIRRARDGSPVLVVATDGQHRYLGRLAARFDKEGILTGFDAKASRPIPVDDGALRVHGLNIDADALRLEQQVAESLATLHEPLAETTHFLNGMREDVRNRQTNLGDFSADAIAFAARHFGGKKKALFALRNGGGIRASIGEIDERSYQRLGGAITELELRNALRFDNPLVLITTTHQGLKDTLESSLREVGTGRGQFPQVSAEVYLEYDSRLRPQSHVDREGQPTRILVQGQQVRTLRITPHAHGKKRTIEVIRDGEVLTPDAPITFATLSFLAEGGDGYFPGQVSSLQATPLVKTREGKKVPITEQAAVRHYLQAQQNGKQWKAGKRYADPKPGTPESFTRIRRLNPPRR